MVPSEFHPEKPAARLRVCLVLEDQGAADGITRLRLILKSLLRRHRFKCTHIAELEDEAV